MFDFCVYVEQPQKLSTHIDLHYDLYLYIYILYMILFFSVQVVLFDGANRRMHKSISCRKAWKSGLQLLRPAVCHRLSMLEDNDCLKTGGDDCQWLRMLNKGQLRLIIDNCSERLTMFNVG